MRTPRVLLLLVLGLSLVGCFDDPVQQRLTLDFRADGAVEVEARVRIRAADPLLDQGAVSERAEELRSALEADGLSWPARLAAVEPERRRSLTEHEGEQLRERSFRALVAGPASLEKLLPDGLVRPLFQRSEAGVNELSFLVEPGTRANRHQQQLVSLREGLVASAYLDYLEACERLEVLRQQTPERARALLWHVLDGSETFVESQTEEPELLEDEEPIVEALSAAMEAVLDALSGPPEGERFTINELSRLVHDPFEFDLVVRLPVDPLESEGFLVGEDPRTLRAPRRSFIEAIEGLSGRWIEPDWLLLLWSGPWRPDGDKLDVEELVTRPRRVSPPLSTAELLSALDEALRPPGMLRVRWAGLPPPDPGQLGWESAPQR